MESLVGLKTKIEMIKNNLEIHKDSLLEIYNRVCWMLKYINSIPAYEMNDIFEKDGEEKRYCNIIKDDIAELKRDLDLFKSILNKIVIPNYFEARRARWRTKINRANLGSQR